jgi:hypothetical protein
MLRSGECSKNDPPFAGHVWVIAVTPERRAAYKDMSTVGSFRRNQA